MRTTFGKIRVKQQFKDDKGTLFQKVSDTQAEKLFWPFAHTKFYNVGAHESFDLVVKPKPTHEPAPF